MQKHTLVLTLSALMVGTGCDMAEEGAKGNIVFTPVDCGRYLGCDFADPIGVGGKIHVTISAAGEISTVGVSLVSDNPTVLLVTRIGEVGGRITWEATGTDAGTARVVALDEHGKELDSIEVTVTELAGLTMQPILGTTEGPLHDTDHDEHWIARGEERVVMDVTPVIGEQAPVMGRYDYVPNLDDEQFVTYINDLDALSKGRLDFTAPAGEYTTGFADDYGHTIWLLIEVTPASPNVTRHIDP